MTGTGSSCSRWRGRSKGIRNDHVTLLWSRGTGAAGAAAALRLFDGLLIHVISEVEILARAVVVAENLHARLKDVVLYREDAHTVALFETNKRVTSSVCFVSLDGPEDWSVFQIGTVNKFHGRLTIVIDE